VHSELSDQTDEALPAGSPQPQEQRQSEKAVLEQEDDEPQVVRGSPGSDAFTHPSASHRLAYGCDDHEYDEDPKSDKRARRTLAAE
jgi:hypothetical protein